MYAGSGNAVTILKNDRPLPEFAARIDITGPLTTADGVRIHVWWLRGLHHIPIEMMTAPICCRNGTSCLKRGSGRGRGETSSFDGEAREYVFAVLVMNHVVL
jgi:hypothetical protein